MNSQAPAAVKVVKVILVKMLLCLSNGLTIIINIYLYYSGGFSDMENDFDQMTK